jgi:hypothetical protein
VRAAFTTRVAFLAVDTVSAENLSTVVDIEEEREYR